MSRPSTSERCFIDSDYYSNSDYDSNSDSNSCSEYCSRNLSTDQGRRGVEERWHNNVAGLIILLACCACSHCLLPVLGHSVLLASLAQFACSLCLVILLAQFALSHCLLPMLGHSACSFCLLVLLAHFACSIFLLTSLSPWA